MRRIISREIMDGDSLTANDQRMVFEDLWRINRWCGGVSGCERLLRRFFARAGKRPVRILDVGAGDGRMATLLQERLAKRRINAEFVSLDRKHSHLLGGKWRNGSMDRVAGDALCLPFQSGSFDAVMSNLVLHHFSGTTAMHFLKSLMNTAREAVLINDLDRRPLPYFLIRSTRLLARSWIARQDGAASVRQAYTRRELISMAAAAGAAEIDYVPLRFFRHGLILWKSPA